MKKVPITWNGIQYESITDCARALGLSDYAVGWRIKQGYTCDDDITSQHDTTPIPCIWNGIQYESIYQASKALGIHWVSR